MAWSNNIPSAQPTELFAKRNVNKLPDAYYKETDGNNHKLLRINELAVDKFSKDMKDVLNSLDIMQATGATLNLYGAMLGVKRGTQDDTQYRLSILTAIGKNVSGGDYNTVVSLLAKIFNCSTSDIAFKEENETHPSCEITIVNFPYSIVLNSGFTVAQIIRLIDELLPTCVRIRSGNFDGTFEFGSVDTIPSGKTFEFNREHGFGDIAQSTGGYFGSFYTI